MSIGPPPLPLSRPSLALDACREMDYKSDLVGSADEGSCLPVVDTVDIEAVVAAWTRIPVERLSEDEKTKLSRLVGDERWRGDAGLSGACACVGGGRAGAGLLGSCWTDCVVAVAGV